MRKPSEHKKYDDETSLVNDASSSRIQKISWYGPGIYYIFKYQQRCSRGCCSDDVFEATHIDLYEKEFTEHVQELSEELDSIRYLQSQMNKSN